jgi:gliding motility-associated-like protein
MRIASAISIFLDYLLILYAESFGQKQFRWMKRNIYKYSALTGLFMAFFVSPASLEAQEGDFTVSIRQPTSDSITRCPGENTIFIGEGLNPNGMPFDYNQATFTWEFGSQDEVKTGATVTHAFEEGGHYLVRLVVTNIDGDTAQNIPEMNVYVGMPPVFTGTRANNTSICSGDELVLTGFVGQNPWTGDEYTFENTYSQSGYKWNGAMIVSDRNGIARAQPPLDEGHQKYIFTVEDDFGCFHDTTLLIFGLYSEYTFEPDNGEAKLEVEFSPKDEENGGSESEIDYIYEAFEVTDQDNILTSEGNVITFERPGQYITWMTASYDQCTFRFDVIDKYVRVDSSLLEVPNVFTPNEDGLNDYFQVKSVSLRSFNGKVFNRWGKLVYQWSDWTTQEAGWNGRNQNDGSEAPTGTYYYIIEATGWDWDYSTEDYKKYTDRKVDRELRLYTGFVTLLR